VAVILLSLIGMVRQFAIIGAIAGALALAPPAGATSIAVNFSSAGAALTGGTLTNLGSCGLGCWNIAGSDIPLEQLSVDLGGVLSGSALGGYSPNATAANNDVASPFGPNYNVASTGWSAFGTAVPEPGTMVLLGAGLLGLAAGARRWARKR